MGRGQGVYVMGWGCADLVLGKGKISNTGAYCILLPLLRPICQNEAAWTCAHNFHITGLNSSIAAAGTFPKSRGLKSQCATASPGTVAAASELAKYGIVLSMKPEGSKYDVHSESIDICLVVHWVH